MANLPRARNDDCLIIQELPDEVVTLDIKTFETNCLGRTAAFVWRMCDGETTVKAMAGRLGGVGLPDDVNIIRVVLGQLEKSNLLVAGSWKGGMERFYTRRTALRRIGQYAQYAAGGAGLFLIESIVAPNVAAAGTNSGGGNNQCISAVGCTMGLGSNGQPCCEGGRCTGPLGRKECQ